MKTLTALIVASGIALSAGSVANAMSDSETIGMGKSMLLGGLYSALSTQGYSTNGIEKLTLNEIVVLEQLLNGDDDDGFAAGQVKVIFERAMAR